MESLFIFLSGIYVVARSKLALMRNLLKCNGDFTKKSRLATTLREVDLAIVTAMSHTGLTPGDTADLPLKTNKSVRGSHVNPKDIGL